MKKLGAPAIGALVIFVVLISGVAYPVFKSLRSVQSSQNRLGGKNQVTKEIIADALTEVAINSEFPEEIDWNHHHKGKVQIRYAIEPKLQKTMKGLFQSYGPDYGAFVALDARTGRVLSLVSFSRSGLKENLALRATFPSASVFKVVTAAAAIGQKKASAETIIAFNGRDHTLYRGQVLQSKITPWTRFITLREAFAKSVNTVFGKVGAFFVGAEGMRQYADRFGFNRPIYADVHVEEGRAIIPDDPWGVAESASGFTRDNTMSPLQGAMIAASVANEGVMMEPFLVQSIYAADGRTLYSALPRVAAIPMDWQTAAQMRRLMQETVHKGTSRGAFRGFFKRGFAEMDVGGKTGSLTGTDPQGKYDWFVGYADSGSTRIAVAALTIHEKKWRVRSSYLARRAIEAYFKENFDLRNVAIR